MKCVSCGRGATWRRVERDGWVLVHLGAGGLHRYCGRCFEAERHEHEPGDAYVLLHWPGHGPMLRSWLEFPELR